MRESYGFLARGIRAVEEDEEAGEGFCLVVWVFAGDLLYLTMRESYGFLAIERIDDVEEEDASFRFVILNFVYFLTTIMLSKRVTGYTSCDILTCACRNR